MLPFETRSHSSVRRRFVVLALAASLSLAAPLAAQPDLRPRAQTLLQQRRFGEALPLLQAFVAQNPTDAGGRADLGRALRGLREFGPATEALQLARQMDPTDVGLAYDLAGVLEEQARYAEASLLWAEAEVFAGAAGLHPERLATIAFRRGQAAAKLERTAEAIDAYRRAVTLMPSNTDFRLGLAEALLNEGRHEEARPMFEELLRGQPNAPIPHYGLGLCLSALMQDELAEQHLRRARELDPKDERFPLALGKHFARKQDATRAFGFYEEATARNPKSKEGFFGMARAARQLGWKDQASQHEATYRELDGQVHAVEESLRDLRRKTRVNPGDVSSLAATAELFLTHARFEEALSTYNQLLAVDPTNDIAALNTALLLARSNETVAANYELEKLLRRIPGHPFANLESGRMLLMMRQPQPAIARIETALKGELDASRRRDAHQMLAQTFAAIGRKEDAARHQAAAQAISVSPPPDRR